MRLRACVIAATTGAAYVITADLTRRACAVSAAAIDAAVLGADLVTLAGFVITASRDARLVDTDGARATGLVGSTALSATTGHVTDRAVWATRVINALVDAAGIKAVLTLRTIDVAQTLRLARTSIFGRNDACVWTGCHACIARTDRIPGVY